MLIFSNIGSVDGKTVHTICTLFAIYGKAHKVRNLRELSTKSNAAWSKVEDQVDLMGTSMSQQVCRIRGLEEAAGAATPTRVEPPGAGVTMTLCLHARSRIRSK